MLMRINLIKIYYFQIISDVFVLYYSFLMSKSIKTKSRSFFVLFACD